MLQKIQLQNFRNYTKRNFEFPSQTTLIVGPNASGKTNILEAIYLLATGKSFRAETEQEMIKEGSHFASVEASSGQAELEVFFDNRGRFTKLYRINGVGKRQIDFVGNVRAVLFGPQDIEIVTDGPSIRRHYLDSVLEQVFKDYRLAVRIYEKALRQRNKLLWKIREFGINGGLQLEYWNKLLINNGRIIHQRRKDYLDFLKLTYDSSVISEERLAKYASEEVAAAATLVGPHRDDFIINHRNRPVKSFGSRGEQRLAVFNIKLGELEYVRRHPSTSSGQAGEDPILLLDDIFSELDHANRLHVLEVIPKQQTIMTTTDIHLVDKRALHGAKILAL